MDGHSRLPAFLRTRNTGTYARVRAAFDRFIYHPITEMVIVVLIVLSVAALIFEAVYDRDARTRRLIEQGADVLTWLFVVELSIRLWVARKKRRFFRQYWIDILAVLPLARPLRFFRVLRLLRLFRAGMLLNRRISLFGGMLRGAMAELTLLGTVTAILVLASAVILYLTERSHTPFSDVEGSLWFSVYSLVGGEPIGGEPQTGIGRVVTLALMFGGLTIFGIFVGTISATMVSRFSKRMDVQEMDLDELSGHTIVCGWNASGPTVLQELFAQSAHRTPVVLITEGHELPEDVPHQVVKRELLYHVEGDYTRVETLRRANVQQASVAILLADSVTHRSDQDRDARTVLAALTIERLSPKIFTCAELRNRENASLLKMAGVEEFVVPEEYSGVILGSVSRNRGLVPVLDEILTTRYGNALHKVLLPASWEGKTVGELYRTLKERHDATLISLETFEGGKRKEVLVNPPSTRKLERGSALVVIATNPVEL